MPKPDEIPRMTLDDSKIRKIVDGVNKRRAGSDEKFLFGAERIDFKYLGNMGFVSKKGES